MYSSCYFIFQVHTVSKYLLSTIYGSSLDPNPPGQSPSHFTFLQTLAQVLILVARSTVAGKRVSRVMMMMMMMRRRRRMVMMNINKKS